MSSALLKYPQKSHRKIIRIPSESIELAELMGIIAGDGGINNDWQLVISLNSIKDLEYAKYVHQLLKNLFNIEVAVRKRPKQNTLVLVCSSINLLDFLVSKGAIKGNKILGGINVPLWIQGNSRYEKAFVKGLVDTDGCLYIHKHITKGKLRKNIGFCFTNCSEKLLNAVADILSKFKIKPHVTDNGKRIYLYSAKAIAHYLAAFGSSNPRITNTYKKWRGAGVV